MSPGDKHKSIAAPVIAAEKPCLLQETLEHYASEYCEGWCKACPETAGPFEDCGGCRARVALAQFKAPGLSAGLELVAKYPT